QLAPLVRGLYVVVHGEAVDEVLLRLVVPTERGTRERDGAVGGGFLVAIAQLETELERGLRLVVALLRAAEHHVALGTTPAKLRDDVAAGDQCERVRQDLVVALERGFGVALLELDVAEVLEAEELGAGFGKRYASRGSIAEALASLTEPAGMKVKKRKKQFCVPDVSLMAGQIQERDGFCSLFGGALKFALLPIRYRQRSFDKR